jgi:Glycosyltransferase family 87
MSARGLSAGALRSPRLPAAVCLAIGAASALPAAYDVWNVATLVIDQLRGPAQGTDFLNLYAGAKLLLTAPHDTYRLEVQQALQRSLTGWDSPLVPFYAPPYAALLVAWLGWFAYPFAYVVWLLIGIACTLVATAWLAPRWTRWYVLVWFGLAMLFLPSLLGLAQGQTSALMLVCAAAFARGMLNRQHASLRLVVGVVGLALKPQFAPVYICALLRAGRWRALAATIVVTGVLSAVAAVPLAAAGIEAYIAVSRQKLFETLNGDPTLLPGPTLLNASHRFLGVNDRAHSAAGLLVLGALLVLVYIWRRGPAGDEAILLQLAILPIVSVIASPYALVYELTIWLVSFWLLWRYTATRTTARAMLLWLTAAVWVAGDIGVGLPSAGGADVAALLGLGAVVYIGWLFHAHAPGTIKRASPRVA